MSNNILKIVNEIRKKYRDDYAIQEGIVLDKTYLIANGYLPDKIRHSKKYYPIYIPGKHPVFGFKNRVKRITDGDLNNPNSDIYNSYNYHEVGVLMREDTPVTPLSRVRVFYNKTSNKAYATMYFEVISSNEKSDVVSSDVTVSNIDYVNSFNSTSNRSVTAISGGQTRRGFYTQFPTMFSQLVGKIIVLRDDELALNMYAVAGQESSWFSGARGDNGNSYGFFQMNTGVHTPPYIAEYIENALDYLDITDKSGIKLSDLSLTYNEKEWHHSVGFVQSTNTQYPIKRESDVNYDIQLLVWLGYMIAERYANRLSTIPVYDDIEKYQNAQRFVESLKREYAKNTKTYYAKAKPERDNKLKILLASKDNIINQPWLFNSPDEKYLRTYYS